LKYTGRDAASACPRSAASCDGFARQRVPFDVRGPRPRPRVQRDGGENSGRRSVIRPGARRGRTLSARETASCASGPAWTRSASWCPRATSASECASCHAE